jgi:nucleoside 2-deoxyribosyltransferase
MIGSLRNPHIPEIAQTLRVQTGLEIFDDWWSASEDADEWWQKHERFKGRSYADAITGYHAKHVFEFDYHHLNRSDGGVLVMPAGRSGHLEFGYLMGQGKRGYILFDEEPERFDVMYQFATGGVFFDMDSLVKKIQEDFAP